jgi:hypothetical protein
MAKPIDDSTTQVKGGAQATPTPKKSKNAKAKAPAKAKPVAKPKASRIGHCGYAGVRTALPDTYRHGLAALIAKSGKSQGMTAEAAGVDRSFLSMIVNGKRGMSTKTASKLARVLGCSVGKLLKAAGAEKMTLVGA